MHRILLNYLLVIVLAVTLSYAYPSPSVPVGNTVWNSGQQVTISWDDSGSPSCSTFSGICISLMTGPDLSQIYLETIAPKLDKTATSASFKVPPLSNFGYPQGKIYFLMFSDSADPSKGISWSTRFTILDGDSKPPITYTPGTPWTITPSGGSTATTGSSNATASANSTTTNSHSSTSTSNSTTTTNASSKPSNKVVVTAYVTPTSTGPSDSSVTQNANPNSNSDSSSNSGSIMSTSLWNDGILTMIACVAFVLII